MAGVISKIPLPEIEILDPIGQTLSDFDITDIAYSKIKGYNYNLGNKNGFVLNEEQGDTNVVLVNIGEQPRGVIGLMINAVDKCGPKVIGIDAIFKDLKPDTLGDMILSESIRNSKKVILACKFRTDQETGKVSVDQSHPIFSDYAQTNYVNLVTDGSDDVAKYKTSRSFFTYKDHEKKRSHFFAIELVKKYAPEKAQKFIDRNNELEFINYVGNIGSYGDKTEFTVPKFTSIEHTAVLNNEFDPSLFKNKIVIFGFMGRTIGEEDIEDIFYSPLNEKYIGKTNPDMFGVVIHANIINMIMTENYIDAVPFWLEFSIAVLICFVGVFMLYWAFLKFPLAYGTLSKMIQFMVWVTVLFSIIGVFYKYKIKYDTTITVVLVALAGDLVEIYHEIFLPLVRKLLKFIGIRKTIESLDKSN